VPSVSQSQQHLMGAAYGGATFPAAKALRSSMTMKQLSDFASTPTKNLPVKVKPQKQAKTPKAKMAGQTNNQPSRRLRTAEYQSAYSPISATLNTASSWGGKSQKGYGS
jgi:hypothetical protein